MTDFILLSSGARSLISLWAVLLCLGFIAAGIYSLSHLQKKNAVLSFILLLFPYFVFQISTEVTDFYVWARIHSVAKFIAELPFIVFVVALMVFTGLCALCLVLGYRYSETHITPKSVKQAADNLSTGFVYYLPGGQIYLANHSMNRLDIELFNHPLLNGAKFAERIANKKIFEGKNGSVYRFTKNELKYKNNVVYEIIAENITEIYRKNETLTANNEALKEHNRRMREYGEQIDEAVKQEEILRAKVRIHDEMNRILLTIGNALTDGSREEREKVLKELETNALLLCMNANHREDNPLSDFYTLAESIGVMVHLNKEPTSRGDALLTFILAAQECMVNAVKHAEAKNFYITIDETDAELRCMFTNDGKKPKGEITESGGLSNLRKRIEKYGGNMAVKATPEFAFSAVIPKEERSNEI